MFGTFSTTIFNAKSSKALIVNTLRFRKAHYFKLASFNDQKCKTLRMSFNLLAVRAAVIFVVWTSSTHYITQRCLKDRGHYIALFNKIRFSILSLYNIPSTELNLNNNDPLTQIIGINRFDIRGGFIYRICLCQLMRSPLRTETPSLDENNIG